MVIDYKNKDQLAKMGIDVPKNKGLSSIFKRGASADDIDDEYGRIQWDVKNTDRYEGVTFCNFPTIIFEAIEFKNCIFKNIQSVEVLGCKMDGCTFENVSSTVGCCTDFFGCFFKNCCISGSILNIDTRGAVEGCTFESMTALGNEGYIIHAVYESEDDVKPIKNCRFSDCDVENDEGKFTYCSYLKTVPSVKKIQVDNFDYESCKVEGNEKNSDSNSDHDVTGEFRVFSSLFRKRQ